MPEIQVGFHTIQSHRLKVARIQLRDWLILVLLAVIELVLYIINPFHCLVRKEWMTDLKYPMQGITVPFWAVPMIAVMLPILMFVLYYLYRRDVYDVHHAIIGLLFSVFITGVITDAIKDAVGRPRPDFFWCCFPDGRPSYDRVIGDVLCHGEKSIIKEGYKSFPSGIHHVGSFAGLGFLSWYLSGKIRAFDRREHVAKLSIVFLPLLTATLIGISVVNDYWHHWQDAFVRGFLGLVVASICYLQFFPLPYDAGGWGPHAYSRMLEESISSAPQPQASCIPIHTTEVESGFALPVNGGNSRIGDGFQTQDMHICCHLKTVETGYLEAISFLVCETGNKALKRASTIAMMWIVFLTCWFLLCSS